MKKAKQKRRTGEGQNVKSSWKGEENRATGSFWWEKIAWVGRQTSSSTSYVSWRRKKGGIAFFPGGGSKREGKGKRGVKG